MRTGEKAGRTAAKRRTEVRRLCVRTILQGDEAQRNNPVIRPSYKERTPWRVFFIPSETTVELLVTRNSLLVTRVTLRGTLRMTRPTPRRAERDTPRRRRWALARSRRGLSSSPLEGCPNGVGW